MRRTVILFVIYCLAAGALVEAADSIAFTVPEFRGVYRTVEIPITLQYEYNGSPPLAAYFFYFNQITAKITTITLNTTAVFSESAGSSHELSFTYNGFDILSSPYFTGSSNASHPTGSTDFDLTIGVRFSASSSTITNSSSQLHTFDGETGIPTLVDPALGVNDVFTGHVLSAHFRVPELPDLSTLRLKLYGLGALSGHVYNLTLSFGLVFPSTTYLVSFDARNPTASSTVSAISGTGSTIPEGQYTFEFSYQDAVGNPAKSASYSPVKYDTYTQAPSLTGWVTNGLYGNPTTIAYTLPEAPYPGSVTIAFYDIARETIVKYMQMVDDLSVSYSWNRNIAAANPPVVAELVLSMGLTDGLYDISLGYSDAASNVKNESIAYNVRFDSVTQAPTLTSVVQTIASTLVTVSFKLPEQPHNNRVTIVFTHSTTPSKSRTIIANVTQPYTLGSTITARINATNGLQYSEIISMTPSTTLLEGSYTVQVSYQDLVPNPVALSSSLGFSVDYTTSPITYTLPATGYSYSSPFVITCNVPDTPLSGQVTLRFKRTGESDIVVVMSVPTSGSKTFQLNTADVASSANVVSTTSSTLPDDTYDSLTFTYQDSLQNPSATTTTGSFTIDTVTQPCTLLLPASGSEIDPVFNVTYKLGEQALGTAEGLVIQMVGADSYTLELASVVKTGGVWHTFLLDSSSPTSSFAVDSGSSFPLGGYTFILRYYDAVGNTPVTCLATGLSMEAASANPQLISPASNSQHANTMLIKYKLRSNLTTEPDALQLVLAGSTNTYTLDFHPIAHSPIGVELQFTVDLLDLTSVANLSSVAGGVLVAEDTYIVTMRADSLDFGVYGTDERINVLVDRTTLAPVITSPITTVIETHAYTDVLPVVFELPETPLANDTQVVLVNQQQPTQTLVFDVQGAALYNFALLRVTGNTLVVDHSNQVWTLNTGTELTWPVYLNVSVQYRDQYANPVAVTTVSGVLMTGNATVNATLEVVVSGTGTGGYDSDSRVLFASSMYDALSISLLLSGVFAYICMCLVDSMFAQRGVKYHNLESDSVSPLQLMTGMVRTACTGLVLVALYRANDERETGVSDREEALPWLVSTGVVALVGEIVLPLVQPGGMSAESVSSRTMYGTLAQACVFVAFVSMTAFTMVSKAPGVVFAGSVACAVALGSMATSAPEQRYTLMASAWVLLLITAAANYN